MKTKYFLIFLVLLLSQISGNMAVAQRCLTFDYDANGNRVHRAVTNNCHEARDIEEVQENGEMEEITVYPNPTEGNFRIGLPYKDVLTHAYYILYDMTGMQIIEGRLNVDETEVDIGNMLDGVYLLKIILGEELFYKIIVKH